MAEKERIENYQETEDAQKQGGEQPQWAENFGIGIWVTTTTGADFRTGAKIRGRRVQRKRRVVSQKEKNPMGRAPMTDPGCKVYHDIGRDLMTKERPLAKNMPLLSEFTRYGDGASPQIDGQRSKMLYNLPLSGWVDYFTNNLGVGE